MLKRQFRLPARQKLKQPQIRTTPYFVCKFSVNGLPYPRFGFVVSKAIDKRSVVRNRTKRLLRFIVEENFNKITPGYDVLFVLRRSIEEKTAYLESMVFGVLNDLKTSTND